MKLELLKKYYAIEKATLKKTQKILDTMFKSLRVGDCFVDIERGKTLYFCIEKGKRIQSTTFLVYNFRTKSLETLLPFHMFLARSLREPTQHEFNTFKKKVLLSCEITEELVQNWGKHDNNKSR